eukprot:Hpha_TRINITY_DN8586_c0_g1::TRINITY_DN8586_c0_g1_i1::g.146355::m.146355
MGLTEHEWGQVAAVFCWLADLFNMISCTDSILQELHRHQATVFQSVFFSDAQLPALDGKYKLMRPKAAYLEFHNSANREERALSQALRRIYEPAAGQQDWTPPMPRVKLGYMGKMRCLARFWNSDCGAFQMRIVLTWLLGALAAGSVIIVIATEMVHYDEWEEDIFERGSNDLARCFLATVVAVLGPLCVMHDWEFPGFEGVNQVHIPGVNTDEVSCTSCCCSCTHNQTDRDGQPLPSRKLPFTSFNITNRWLTFVPFMLAICLDFIMLKDTFLYAPGEYGQYTNPVSNSICSTRNQSFAEEIRTAWRATKINPVNYTERLAAGFLNETNGTDFCIPAKYNNSSSALKLIICLPGFLVYVWFAVCILRYAKMDRLLAQLESQDPGGDDEVQEVTRGSFVSPGQSVAADPLLASEPIVVPTDVAPPEPAAPYKSFTDQGESSNPLTNKAKPSVINQEIDSLL